MVSCVPCCCPGVFLALSWRYCWWGSNNCCLQPRVGVLRVSWSWLGCEAHSSIVLGQRLASTHQRRKLRHCSGLGLSRSRHTGQRLHFSSPTTSHEARQSANARPLAARVPAVRLPRATICLAARLPHCLDYQNPLAAEANCAHTSRHTPDTRAPHPDELAQCRPRRLSRGLCHSASDVWFRDGSEGAAC
jgi:hypothetical protein